MTSGRGLPNQLTWRDAFRFPIATPEGRHDVLVGGLAVIFLLPIGWILNLGARLDVVHRLFNSDQPYFRGFKPWRWTFRRGCVSATTIFCYLSPAILSGTSAWYTYHIGSSPWVIGAWIAIAFAAFVLGVFTLPGCMTVYACEKDPSVLWHPARAFRRAREAGEIYLRAWLISLAAVSLSTLGLLGLGIGFVFTSVWSWEVVGYAFTVAMYAPTVREAVTDNSRVKQDLMALRAARQ
ncbi:MAG TPA: hypothetical protein VJ840_08475 [Gemmatimonadaceae bacterium]|nr:hypothetical protein [Gemmatimonadaceae bacterium]